MEIPAISGHHQKKQHCLQDKTPTPQTERITQFGVFSLWASKLDNMIGISVEFDNLPLVMRPSYVILAVET